MERSWSIVAGKLDHNVGISTHVHIHVKEAAEAIEVTLAHPKEASVIQKEKKRCEVVSSYRRRHSFFAMLPRTTGRVRVVKDRHELGG